MGLCHEPPMRRPQRQNAYKFRNTEETYKWREKQWLAYAERVIFRIARGQFQSHHDECAVSAENAVNGGLTDFLTPECSQSV